MEEHVNACKKLFPDWIKWEYIRDLIEMMRHEGIMEKGHLQINKNIITWLTDRI